MSLPPINPERTTSGITLDPRTQQRVVPQTRRPDGSLRKELKIRDGFTPQEDFNRFRGSKQQQMDRNALPKGHILGWIAPTGAAAKKSPAGSSDSTGKPLTKSQAKNAKRREKKREDKVQPVQENWDDEEEDAGATHGKSTGSPSPSTKKQEVNVDALAEQLKEKANVE